MIELLLLMLPMYIANTVPPILAKIPLLKKLNMPMDLKFTFRKKRIFGSHKTWRGFIGGTIIATAFFLIQQQTGFLQSTINVPIYYGTLLAIGALLGDAVESFAKRQLHYEPGKTLFFWDQTDFVIGAMLLTFWIYWPGLLGFLFLLIFSALVSLSAHTIGYFIGVNEKRT